MPFNFLHQAEQTPELEDKYIPTLLETPDTKPRRRPWSPQVHSKTNQNYSIQI